jgi:hypothetical protein
VPVDILFGGGLIYIYGELMMNEFFWFIGERKLICCVEKVGVYII